MGKHSVDDSVTEPIVVTKDGGFMTPTQVENKWRTVARTVFQVVIGLAAIVPLVVPALGLSTAVGAGAAAIAVAAAVTRVMSIPAVNEFLDRFVPWLRAQ